MNKQISIRSTIFAIAITFLYPLVAASGAMAGGSPDPTDGGGGGGSPGSNQAPPLSYGNGKSLDSWVSIFQDLKSDGDGKKSGKTPKKKGKSTKKRKKKPADWRCSRCSPI